MLNKAKNWSFIFIALFVFSQTAGLLHAEVHHFHEHEESCDVYENLAHPYDSQTPKVEHHAVFSQIGQQITGMQSGVYEFHTAHFFGRAPPLS